MFEDESEFDPSVKRLTTPEECRQYIINVKEKWPKLAQQADQRELSLLAHKHAPSSPAEFEALQATYAYEKTLAREVGRKAPASRTRQMIKKFGIIQTMERLVDRPDDPSGYAKLVTMGLEKLSFEAVVLRHRAEFSAKAIESCEKRIARLEKV